MSKNTLGAKRVSYSPATKPGYNAGRRPGNASRKWPAEVLTLTEVWLLMTGCSRTSSTGLRNRAIIATLYRGGLRCAECLGLYPHDVDHDNGTLRVRNGKGGKSRTVGIDAGGLEVIAVWEERRAKLGLDGTFPLMCSLHGTMLAGAYVRSFLKRIAKQAGIQRRVTPHGLRHSHAFELANEGFPLYLISRQLGHSNVGTTDRYITHLAPMQVVEAMRARSWSA